MIRSAGALALAGLLAIGSAAAQGVAPGGGIGNSTGIGSGLGGGGGTGPSYPNGTQQPSLPAPTPPGGSLPSIANPPSVIGGGSSSYPQPRAPFDATTPKAAATVPLALSDKPGGDLAFLKGCWRSEVFAFAQHSGTTTWCFDDKGTGRYLYARTDQPNVFCNSTATAAYGGDVLHLHGFKTNCTEPVPLDLDCRADGEAAICRIGDAVQTRLYRVR